MMILNLMKFQGVTKALSIHVLKDMNLLLYAYNSFHKEAKHSERKQKFIETESSKFLYLFDGEEISLSTTLKEKLLQIIIRNILKKRILMMIYFLK